MTRSFLVTLFVSMTALLSAQSRSLYIEDLTWMEVRDLVASGKTTAIVYSGSIEQNGPHMALGKHLFLAHYIAGKIAEELGDALVYPTIPFAPTGDPIPEDRSHGLSRERVAFLRGLPGSRASGRAFRHRRRVQGGLPHGGPRRRAVGAGARGKRTRAGVELQGRSRTVRSGPLLQRKRADAQLPHREGDRCRPARGHR